LGKTNHILDTFSFLLQVCRYLLEAAKSGNVNTTKRWVHCTNDSCTSDDVNRDTPLTHAAWDGHVEVVRVLLEGGADIQRVNLHNESALHYAARNGHLEVCRLLLDRGAKVNIEGWRNETALHWAAGRGHLSVVKLLVERGADARLRDVGGLTARDMAGGKGRITGPDSKRKEVADWLDSVSRV
jgi:ankyrin repeat protein